MAIPKLKAVSQMELAKRALMTRLESTRLRAVSEDRCYLVRFNPQARTFQIASKRTTTPCGTTGFVNDGPPHMVDDTDTIEASATKDPVFDTWGNAVANVMIRLTTTGGESTTISVNTEGRISGR